MDRLIPPELLQGMPQGPPQGGGGLPPGFIDGPSEDPNIRMEQAAMGATAPSMPMDLMGGGMDMGMGGMPGEMGGQPPMDMMSPLTPGVPQPDPDQMGDPSGGQDPILAALLAQAQQNGPKLPDKQKERKAKVRKPEPQDILAIAERDRQMYMSTVERMSRDVSLYRQHDKATPKSFKADRETAVASAEFGTLINKLSNMFSGASQIYEVPYDTVPEEKSAQLIEDALYSLRKLASRSYAQSGGNLQRDEFFYMFLHGRYVKRILPDLEDNEYPFAESLLDPATCFPTFGGAKKGMIRMVRRYQSTVGDVISTYGEAIPAKERKIATKLGYEDYSSASEWMNESGEVIEYWDSWWRYVTFKGEEVMPVTAHGIGEVPFVYMMPVGEPASMSTPGGHYQHFDDRSGTSYPIMMGSEHDLAEKGVSVFHHLINTHRIKEMLMTILYNQVEAATDPATITYTAPHLGGKEPQPLDTKRGGNNVRQMNFQNVEGVPTSPRPTDFSPLFSTIQQEMVEGSFPPGMFGAEQGSNQTGSGADAMMQNAKDLVLPYIQGWEQGQARECTLKLKMYIDIISPVITISAPAHDSRGEGKGDVQDLSPFDVEQVGTFVEVKMIGMSMQNEAAQIAAMNQAVQAGFFSQRHAMGKLNVLNPDKMFAEIISEKAMQHPEIMENFIIPEGFIANDQKDFAEMWAQLVIAPKMMQMQQAAQQGQAPPAPDGGGSQAVPDPLQGMLEQGAGGAPEGEGRGPAMPDAGMMGI